MENSSTKPRVTPKDFFLWVAAMATLYGSVVSFITLLFNYIDYAFPDALNYYVDPYSGGIRFAMASLIVLFPIFLVLMRLIRRGVIADSSKADIWIRRWALYLTLFIAGVTIAVDLIVLINTFLGGELTTRFILKVVVVLLVVGAGFLHFLSDLWGHWNRYPNRAQMVGYAAGLAIVLSVLGGFFIIGSPASQRLFRFDAQKVSDLQTIQWQVVSYWQQKEKLPANLSELQDPIQGFLLPRDPQSGEMYSYRTVGTASFELCATFNKESRDVLTEKYSVPRPVSGIGLENENWQHAAGQTCFERTIDPERYPPFPKR